MFIIAKKKVDKTVNSLNRLLCKQSSLLVEVRLSKNLKICDSLLIARACLSEKLETLNTLMAPSFQMEQASSLDLNQPAPRGAA